MPLRDHFRPPVGNKHSWDALHAMWPATIVQHLHDILPEGYIAAPGVYLGQTFEIDVSAYEEDEPAEVAGASDDNGGVAVATRTAPPPTLTVEADSFGQDEYEVRVYDLDRARTLVAAIEIVSPSNKDRPDSRRAFVAKCAGLLQQDVSVTIVDLVTPKQFNLYAELLELIDRSDPALSAEPSPVYAATLRGRKNVRKRTFLDAWFHPLILGQPLPSLPLWLAPDLSVTLELETSYEAACLALRIA